MNFFHHVVVVGTHAILLTAIVYVGRKIFRYAIKITINRVRSLFFLYLLKIKNYIKYFILNQLKTGLVKAKVIMGDINITMSVTIKLKLLLTLITCYSLDILNYYDA